MKFRSLGQTGLTVSEIGVGAWQLGGPLLLDGKVDGHPELGRDYCVDLIRQCGELGINFVDTAEQYGNGESERRVGEAIKGKRAAWIVGSKFGHQVGPKGERVQDASPQRLPLSLEGSLRRLQTDYLDVYVYHVAPKPGQAEHAAEFLNAEKRKGRVCAVGISTNDLAQVEYLHSLGCLDVVQFGHNLLQPARAMTSFLARHGVGGIVRGAFAGGKLSGRYFHAPPQWDPDDIRAAKINPTDFGRYAVFEQLLSEQRGMIQLTLRYLLDEPATATIIPGGKSVEDYRQAIRATEIPALTKPERARIEALSAELNARERQP